MIDRRKLLIATTNPGKLKEIQHFLGDLPFELISLSDLDMDIPEPEETGGTFAQNSFLKAEYYGKKTNLLTMGEDSGLCIDAKDGWPGVRTSRETGSSPTVWQAILKAMENETNRRAHSESWITIYEPETMSHFTTMGKTKGSIITTSRETQNGFGFDPVFLVEELQKTYSELTPVDKNSVSHRGKALLHVKRFIQTYYAKEHLVVPVAIIIQSGKLLSALRNDPHRPAFHKKWELPGGRMEYGEEIPENLVREVKEETGYDIEIVKRLDHIEVDRSEWYQVYLLPHVCRIVGGDGVYSDAEILDIEFVELDAIFDRDLVGNDPKMLRVVMPELKRIIKEQNL